MHYVRFLRPPTIAARGPRRDLSIVLILSTDLGDSLLSVSQPLPISILLFEESNVVSQTPTFAASISWNPGARVAKHTIPLPDRPWRQILVTVEEDLAAVDFPNLAVFARDSGASPRNPLIMPAWFDFKTGNRPAGRTDVCLRKLRLSGPLSVEFEEEFGDSIARHVWDGGLAAVSFLTQLHEGKVEAGRKMPYLSKLLFPDNKRPLNILELGCGVGVLGIGLAGLLSLAASPEVSSECHLLMTDVPDAEERALANIGLFQDSQGSLGGSIPTIEYENLDWEADLEVKFSESIVSRPWDLVVLSDCTYNIDTIPALVETLSQLHSTAAAHQKSSPERQSLKVFLATKPRHSSEQAMSLRRFNSIC
ncbi:uncharacterized protein DNG_01708 [Cephalotrichum gorgonifer]|uniref:Methyltransferase-domain-containing protein n=1 Tax=Cephalotrichum gorgonifer TaxID=2041049 RepID=A0AAE8MS11_9PEZI|nr:uncharacterized protein DNG_01708 [Cephalotrichum gorgonifer]